MAHLISIITRHNTKKKKGSVEKKLPGGKNGRGGKGDTARSKRKKRGGDSGRLKRGGRKLCQ